MKAALVCQEKLFIKLFILKESSLTVPSFFIRLQAYKMGFYQIRSQCGTENPEIINGKNTNYEDRIREIKERAGNV